MKRFLALVAIGSLTVQVAGADYLQSVDGLLPRLADADVGARYAAQMELQDLASRSSTPGNEADRIALAKVLAAKAADNSVAQPARVWIVRQLQYMGDAESVPALTQLLGNPDPELREVARRALEQNASSTASTSLREALAQGGTVAWKIGLINSLGRRDDLKAVPLIVDALPDPATADAAALALGAIASAEAIDALLPLLNQNPAVAEALIQAGNQLERQDLITDARAIYRSVLDDCPFGPARAAALTALLEVNRQETSLLLTAALLDPDAELRSAAIAAARPLSQSLSPVLASLLPEVSTDVQLQILGVLDQEAEPILVAALFDEHAEIQQVAAHQLGQVGTGASIPALVELSVAGDRTAREEAKRALITMPGAGPVYVLELVANAGSPEARSAAIQALTARDLPNLGAKLVAWADDENSAVSRTALSALGRLGADEELMPVAVIAIESNNADALSALESIASRVTDPAGASMMLLALTEDNQPARLAIMDVLAMLGGDETMSLLTELLSGPRADDAVRALGRWPNGQALQPLLKVAVDTNTPKARHTLALQSIVELITTHEQAPVTLRSEAALAVLAQATTVQEKRLALSAVSAVPSAKLAEVIKPMLSDADVKAEAQLAGVALAERLVANDKAAAIDLAKAVLASDPDRNAARRAQTIIHR